MATVMLQLGLLQFSIKTAAYQKLTRNSEYRWARQPRIGASDALQFTGYGVETITLEGSIYPHFLGGFGQIEKMRRQSDLSLPMPLISGSGHVLGLWVVESISETQKVFAANGAPQRQDFTLGIGRYDGGLRAILPFA